MTCKGCNVNNNVYYFILINAYVTQIELSLYYNILIIIKKVNLLIRKLRYTPTINVFLKI